VFVAWEVDADETRIIARSEADQMLRHMPSYVLITLGEGRQVMRRRDVDLSGDRPVRGAPIDDLYGSDEDRDIQPLRRPLAN
jgi:hypothetical protein